MRILFTCLVVLCSGILHAQNLVPNPGFEEHSKCPSDISQFKKVKDWVSPTKGTPDYYCTCANKDGNFSNAGVPLNKMGNQKPHGGQAYAGLIAYNAINYSVEREYLQVKLTEPLIADSEYRVSFYVSLGDASDFATDALGAYISQTPLKDNKWGTLNEVPQVLNPSGNILTNNEWTCVSGIYKATGGEQYLVIGNFLKPADLKIQKRPKSHFNGYSYYFIDDVSMELKSARGSVCQVRDTILKTFNKDTVIATKTDSIQLNSSIVLNNIFFETDKAVLLPSSDEELNKLVTYLLSHPNYSILLSGHTDNQGNEAHNQKLSEARANSVANYIIAKGIKGTRVEYKGYGSIHPITTNDTPEGRQKNRRVEFKILNK
jgi:OOP family OmpA-OmpF porin